MTTAIEIGIIKDITKYLENKGIEYDLQEYDFSEFGLQADACKAVVTFTIGAVEYQIEIDEGSGRGLIEKGLANHPMNYIAHVKTYNRIELFREFRLLFSDPMSIREQKITEWSEFMELQENGWVTLTKTLNA